MFDDARHEDAGPWQCAKCKSLLRAPLMFCPACGANRLTSRALAPRPGEPVPVLTDRLHAWYGAPAAGAAVAWDHPPIAYDSIDENQPVPRSRLPLYACSALAVASFVAAAYLILPRSEWEPTPGVQTIAGSVGGGWQIASRPARDALAVQADLAPREGWSPFTGKVAAGHSSRRTSKSSANAHADVARELTIARANLTRNSLWPAHRAIANALAAQPDNRDGQRMRSELASRERERDALLGHARQCARNGQWDCVRHYAGRAAAVDTSSRGARRLLARASSSPRETTPRRADPDLVGQLQRWFDQSARGQRVSVSPPHAASSWQRP